MKGVVDRCEVTTVQAGDRREVCRTVDAGEILAATLRALSVAGERERHRGYPEIHCGSLGRRLPATRQNLAMPLRHLQGRGHSPVQVTTSQPWKGTKKGGPG